MGRPRTNDDTVKERLVVTATELFATRPPESVTIRALAAAAGAATAAVYTLFGSKEALVEEVRARAVAGLFGALSAVPRSPDALTGIETLAAAYRRWALDQPHLYTVLFGGVRTFEPTGPVGTGDPIGILLDAIGRACDEGVLSGDEQAIALSIWVSLHGLVTLELAGALTPAVAEATFAAAIPAVLRGWRPGRDG
ncbi:hypothetical protein Afil01_33550 [Actinorhabdospora filicis]|uniref:HTH tetR-type domain-containing protein n=1 Tax=Actinorhabdospora filicis TaxID=1785913 RepID=A0A9W6WA07_9ACTN|nr:TetR/AcrR family transcriptional regulator [Actinorhabdospora filicis]GLZ78548.1 hypothetical protein Afil01_33550 [Actinorhabdospora filicis]